MFYRRKILLSLFQVFGDHLDKISLQKLLLLLTVEQSKPVYEFVPHKYGCYSFSAKADLTKMVQKGLLVEDNKSFKKVEKKNYLKELKDADKIIVRDIRKRFYNSTARELMNYTYRNYPFYAINSEVARDMLSINDYSRISESRPKSNEVVLYTIGYEGISLEAYLNRLLKHDVKLLIDVRKNSTSMKYGFSKKTLSLILNKLSIKYLHIPELGINSEYRKGLDTQYDYEALFTMYREENLPKTLDEQKKVLSLLKENKRIALTCFEADKCECHRSHLADSIENLEGFKYKVSHI